MSLEDRLRRHFQQAAQRLYEPPGRLGAVVRAARRRRALQRGAALAAAAAIVIAVPLVVGALSEQTVELEPLAPAGTGTATPAPPSPEPSPEASPDPSPGVSPDPDREPSPEPEGDVATPPEGPLALGDLGAAVLAYGPRDGDPLLRVDREGEQVLWPGPVDAAFPDGQGGVVLQPAGEAAVVWLPDGEQGRAVRLAGSDQELGLRGLLPDGRALYSVRPPDGEVTEGDREGFFAVALSEGAQPEPAGDREAYESWLVGPVTAAGGEAVHAACHTHCALWPGLADAPADAEPLYQGLSVEGLTATPDGRVLAFVEFDVVQPDLVPVELVLLDGASFEVIARVELPLAEGQHPGTPQVSLSADGQRVLVALGTGTPPEAPVTVPEAPYLVEGALTEAPVLHPVEAPGPLRWQDPVEASRGGGRVTGSRSRRPGAGLRRARGAGRRRRR